MRCRRSFPSWSAIFNHVNAGDDYRNGFQLAWLGRWLIHAIRQQDYAAISAGVMVIGSLVIVVNVISDILGAMANPLKHKEWYALR